MAASRLFSVSLLAVSLSFYFFRAAAADEYYVLPIADLEVLEGERPKSHGTQSAIFRNWRRWQVIRSYAVEREKSTLRRTAHLGREVEILIREKRSTFSLLQFECPNREKSLASCICPSTISAGCKQ